MFYLSLPLAEKIVRPVLVYLALIAFLRLFGKRELAQLNPFDLVVLLSLSNTVQNAIIGDDNSVTGGMVGAFSLLSANYVLNRVLNRAPRLDTALQGRPTVLVRNGKPDAAALEKEMLSRQELIQVLHRQNVRGLGDVKECTLEPNGTFYVESTEDSLPRTRHEELLARLEALTREVQGLREGSARS